MKMATGHRKVDSMSDLIEGEINVISNYINSGDVVFDVGGHKGEWSLEVLGHHNHIDLHVFEPVPASYEVLLINMKDIDAHLLRFCVSCEGGTAHFWNYPSVPVLSTIYKRDSRVMERLGIAEPERISVEKITLDHYCEQAGVRSIDFLKIDTEGSELDVLKGAEGLLRNQNIKFIQFEYGGCFPDAGITLKEVHAYLDDCGYAIGKITADKIIMVADASEVVEDFGYCNYLGMRK